MEGKYISDETYKKGQGAIKKVRTVLLIVGALLLAGGITLIILGAKKSNSISVGSSGWMGARLAGSGMTAGGAFMIVFGIACFMYSLIATIIAHKREIMAFEASAVMPVAGEVGEKVINFADKNAEKVGNFIGKAVGSAAGGIAGGARKGWREGATSSTEKPIVCPKCGYKNDTTDKFCGGCGEKLEQKKYCSNCGNEVKETDKFCSACGAKVE